MGIFIVDKPLSLTSHDVVARARRLLGTRRVGHAGTLDPLATGVLVVLSDAATKLSPFLTASRKAYLAWVSFGPATATLDAEPPIIHQADASNLQVDEVRAKLDRFLSLTQQQPPAFSAIKQGGQKSYDAARRGDDLNLPPRDVKYYAVELLAWATSREQLPCTFSQDRQGNWHVADDTSAQLQVETLPDSLGTFPTALVYVSVQAGTYIRAFARDLGEAVGMPAHLSGLVRVQAGRAGITDAVGLEQLDPNHANAMRSLRAINILTYPEHMLNDQEVVRVRQGQRLSLQLDTRTAFVDETRALVAIAETNTDTGRMKLVRVWQEGI
ncbi:MAG: tRNA pseudouridine(55) synthase TruB [Deinococcota bacterium]